MSAASQPIKIAPTQLADAMTQTMSALLATIEQETILVRDGDVRGAMAMEPKKAELSRAYLTLASEFKAQRTTLARTSPALLQAVQVRHESFSKALQLNLTVLATAHAVCEGIVRGVNGEMQRRNAPQTYTGSGTRAAYGARHAAPIALSRSL